MKHWIRNTTEKRLIKEMEENAEKREKLEVAKILEGTVDSLINTNISTVL